MDKISKIKHLQEISKILKSEFVGLDKIIDQLISSITPWYVTPEIIERPVILSLWGMTGTGKSSIVRRLVELLDLKSKSLFVDCGEITGDGGYFRLSDKINEFLFGEWDDCTTERGVTDPIFIFDEFQYARTLDNQRNEIEKAAIRPVWSIIDNGKLDIVDYQYGLVYFRQLVLDLGDFISRHPGIKVNRCVISERPQVEEYVNELGFYFYNRQPVQIGIDKDNNPYRPHPMVSKTSLSEDEEEKLEDDPYRPLNILDLSHTNPIAFIYRGMDRLGLGKGKEMMEKIYSSTTLEEVYHLLAEVIKVISSPKIIDCSKSLVFIIGNLDEAFKVEDEVSPDMSADIFNDITSKVTISDIKSALQERFRAEQVARLGNNLIKYPTLREADFMEIIQRELRKIFTKFVSETGITVHYKKELVDLAYSEGVFPTQGVRPVFTTIITLLTPVLSEIILGAEETGEKVAHLKVISDYPSELGFRVPSVKLQILYGPEEERPVGSRELELNLQLGTLRYPLNRKRRFSTSVHEIGHAILSCWWTGNVPVNIVSVSTDDGGFCDTYDPSHAKEIQSMEEIKADVEIGMAGYLAEQLVFGEGGDRGKILTGSSDDLKRSWNKLSTAAYCWGLFGFEKYSNQFTQSRMEEVPVGKVDLEEVNERVNMEWDKLQSETTSILETEKKLLKEAALVLSEVGSITQEEFTEMIKKWGNKLNLERMEERREIDKWYENKLKNL